MIKSSFIFLPKIKEKKEIEIWQQGIKNWDGFLSNKIKGISQVSKHHYNRILSDASHALYDGNSGYFHRKLPSTETWRLYDFFKEEACFLDIETSGLRRDSYLTLIGLFDGIDTKVMIKGTSFDILKLRQELSRYKLLVTFNGSSFDLPFLERNFPGLLPLIPHIDLRHVCKKIGLVGGLKQIEKQLGIRRKNFIVERFYGGDAVKLWRMYMASGDEYYLNLLIEYNEEDVVNLKKIADYSIGMLKEKYNNFLK